MPSTLKKFESARANGAKSRGPVTPEGKARSRMNALRHGLTAEVLILPGENGPLYQETIETFDERFLPHTLDEISLVQLVVSAHWRQRRLWQLEAASLSKVMDDRFPLLESTQPNLNYFFHYASGEARCAADAFEQLTAGNGVLHFYRRYNTALGNTFIRALRAFQWLRHNPLPPPGEAAPPTPAPDPQPSTPEPSPTPTPVAPAPVSTPPVLPFPQAASQGHSPQATSQGADAPAASPPHTANTPPSAAKRPLRNETSMT